MKRLALVCLAACSGGAPAVRATDASNVAVDANARPVVDGWVQSIGGRERMASLAAIHARGTYTKGGITGTIDLWETARGERREDITLGFLHEERVYDGARGWLVDRNAEVRDLDGFELDDQRALAFHDVVPWFAVGEQRGAIVMATEHLVLSPDGGHRAETVRFDAEHRPVEIVRRDGEKQRSTKLEDWRDVAGVAVPTHLHEDNGDPNDAVDIRLATIERATPPPFTRPADRAPDMTGTASVPFDLAFGGLVFVDVTVNGTPMAFVLDTGAESTVLNASRLGALGLTATGTFAAGAGGGDVTVGYVPHVTYAVGGAVIRDQIVSAINLDDLEKPLGRKLDGILGYDFLSRFVVELDYGRKQLRLRDRATYHHAGGTPLPITLEDSTPYVDAQLELPKVAPLTGHFTLDTGCLCEVEISSPFTDEHELLVAVPNARNAGFSAGAGGETHQVSATITALTVGSHRIDKPVADFSRDKTGATADPESAGLIGSIVWRRFVLVLDYKRKQVWLDPP
ncbi:MAG: retropepsin-like domain-containing protein [Deltaproteobacteria bacterium]|nr:retropepsin-like domain-containing protein [Deltaproteobacteria bacterium]